MHFFYNFFGYFDKYKKIFSKGLVLSASIYYTNDPPFILFYDNSLKWNDLEI